MSVESKVAWSKGNTKINSKLREAIFSGAQVSLSTIHEAMGGSQDYTIFSDGRRSLLLKDNYVIFQYCVLLCDGIGRVATFSRARHDQGRVRITYGKSILLSISDSRPPSLAVPSLLREKLSLGRKFPIENIRPIGMVWNELPKADNRSQPIYVMTLYEVLMPACRLNGVVRHYPDTFLDWCNPSDLRGQMNGYVDDLLIGQLAHGKYVDENRHGGRLLFSSRSRLRNESEAPDAFEFYEF